MNINSKPLVLVVDDDPTNLTILEHLFRREYVVMRANNGFDALQLLQEHDFDLLVLDIMMPQMSGLEVVHKLRSDPKTQDLPVILLSARVGESDVVEGLAMGANDFVAKPFRLSELQARAATQIMLKRLQDERKQTINELQSAHEMKDRFFRIASHDLKGPISNIKMTSYLMRRQQAENDDLGDMLDTIDMNLTRMQNVIEEFLDTAALQAGRIDIRLSAVPVQQVINELVKLYSASALKKDITLETDTSTSIVCADEARFTQALGNLVSNAIKYSSVGGRVKLYCEQHGDMIRICVADDGPGIVEEERNRLFTQFGKLSARPTGGESSTGLGLWIAKHLTVLQQGEIGVETGADSGSIFWVAMPCSSDAVPVPEPVVQRDSARSGA